MAFTLNIDAARYLDALRKAPDDLHDEVMQELGEQMEAVAARARAHHRYTTRSGDLERATQSRVHEDLVGEAYVEPGIAEYGRFVYLGHGSWKKDRFLHKAMRRLKSKITEGVNAAVSRAVEKAGF